MKNKFSTILVIISIVALSATPVSALVRGNTPFASEPELGQLKVCKVAGNGVELGKLFTIKVGDTNYKVPAGPSDGGYCVLAGQYPLKTLVTVQEVIPSGYYVARIELKPSRAVSKDVASGEVVVKVGYGVTEVIFTNKAGTPPPTPSVTPTTSVTSTPRPTKTSTPTPECEPNCTPTPTSVPKGRLQICKEADGTGVSGYFTFNYGSKSVTIPAGACSSLLTVEAGSLTITEVSRAGYIVTDVYTIPSDRLLSKNVGNRTANVTIVEGNAASQTIAIFKNRAQLATSTPTATATVTTTITPTVTTTPQVCQPVVVTADYSQVAVGESVEGMGVVAPGLNIDAKGTAVKVLSRTNPTFYFSPNVAGNRNNGIDSSGGFSDLITKDANQPYTYTFTFAPGTTVSNFSLHMLDYGDLNPTLDTNHYVSMTAYNVAGVVVDLQELQYTTLAELNPRSSKLYGDLFFTGDATDASPGQPGNWMWDVSGNGIVEVVLDFGVGYDSNIALDLISFTADCPLSCQPKTSTADYSNVGVGESVEGIGVVAPGLNIDANGTPNGTAVKVLSRTNPTFYFSPNVAGIRNNEIDSNGGFSDLITKDAGQVYKYTFTFAPGTTVSNFSLHMLDYGDLNPTLDTNHYVSMTAYNAAGAVVDLQELQYTTLAELNPRSSNLYGDLFFTGDATDASPGQPGNWMWDVSGNGIVEVILNFGVGYDSNIALDLLRFTTECP
jgi:hypothetical protein